MRVHLVGLGAVGAGYGSRILAAGHDLRVLVDADRRARYHGASTTVNARDYRFPLLDPGAGDPADVVIVAVKSPALRTAIELLRPTVGANTVILSLLNGVDSERILAEEFPQARVLLSVTVGIDAVRVEREIRYTSLGRIVFGEAEGDAGRSPAVDRMVELLTTSDIDHVVGDDMAHQLWWKFLINVGVNQVSAVLKAPYRVFQASDSPARAAMIAAQREVIAVANAEGVALSDKDLDAWLDVLAQLGPDNFTSMAQDALAGRETEVDIFAGRVCEFGRRHGIATPVNELLAQLLAATTFDPSAPASGRTEPGTTTGASSLTA